MRTLSTEHALADMRHTAIVLRLVLDKRGLIVHGELLSLEGKSLGHFIGWRGLTRKLKTWLLTQR